MGRRSHRDQAGVGALIGGLIAGESGDLYEALAAALGGTTAFGSHSTKASLRLAVNASPEPISNIALSLSEDGAVVGVLLLAIHHPWAALVIALALLFFGVVLATLAIQRIRRSFVDCATARQQRTRLGPMAGKGAFFLGRTVDPSGKAKPENLSLDSADLTTHGVIVGMTGSGKTGLGIVLLEEALLAGIPALILDPKGDMGNLLLTFPELSAAGASAPGSTRTRRAARACRSTTTRRRPRPPGATGSRRRGSGPSGSRQLRDAADFDHLHAGLRGRRAAQRHRLAARARSPGRPRPRRCATRSRAPSPSLLGLVGIKADPLSSREHILLANLIENAWRAGQDLDLGDADRPGADAADAQARRLRPRHVLPAEGPDRARAQAQRAARLAVVRGVGRGRSRSTPVACSRTPEGKPRAAIVYLAHLSDEERQFVVTLVLSKLVTWMRGQPGTSDLRALVVHGRGVRLRPADRGAAGEEADPDDPQAGAGLRRRHGALDAEPGRPRLQGDVERRHVDGRPPADRERQGARARGARVGCRRRRRRRRSTRRSAGSRSASSCSSARRRPAGRLHDALGDVVPARAADEGSDLDADEGRAATAAPRRSSRAAGWLRRRRPRHPRRSGRGRRCDTCRSSGCERRSRALPRPGGPLGRSRRRRCRADSGCARIWRRGSVSASTTRRRRSTSSRSTRLSTALSTPASTSTPRRLSTTTTATSPPTRQPAPPTCSRRAARRGLVLPQDGADIKRRLVDSMTLELRRNLELKLTARPGETPEQFGARCDLAAQDAADAETARIKQRLEAQKERLEKARDLAQRRVEELTTDERSRHANELIAGAGAVLGALLGGRRSTRSIAGRGQRGRVAARDVVTHRRSGQTARRRSTRAEDELDAARAGDPRRGPGDRREVGKASRRSRRSRSVPKPPTSTSSDLPSSGCPRPSSHRGHAKAGPPTGRRLVAAS